MFIKNGKLEGECILDPRVSFDVDEILPKYVQELIEQCEELNNKDDWMAYSFVCDNLWVTAKNCYAHQKISYKAFRLIEQRYCGYE